MVATGSHVELQLGGGGLAGTDLSMAVVRRRVLERVAVRSPRTMPKSGSTPQKDPAAGPPDRPHLQRIVADLSEGVILIEADHQIAWANPAALVMHGCGTLADLGGTPEDYRRRFDLTYRDGRPVKSADYPADRLIRGEVFSDLVVNLTRRGEPDPDEHPSNRPLPARSGRDHILQLRGVHLPPLGGGQACMALVLCDVTEAFEAEERFERMFNANPAPAVIIRVADLRYVRVNEGFLQLSGHSHDDIVGRTLYDLDILAGAEQRDLAKDRLKAWRTIPQMEAELPLPNGDTKLVILAGHPVEMRDEHCIIFTFADLEPRRRAELALRQSEERFAKSFRLAPAPMKLATLDGHRILNVNHAFLQITGWAYEEVVGRKPADLELWENGAVRREVERRLAESGSFRAHELKLKAKDGRLIDCLVSAETVTINGQLCVLSVFQDISERKRTEMELITAIEAAMQDSSWLSRNIMDKLAALRATPTPSGPPPAFDLTRREREVIALIAQGKSDAAIAEALALSRNTIRNHVARLYAKIGVHSRSEAVVWARERGHAGSRATAKA
jgi:PAS domain S-box-containing protein